MKSRAFRLAPVAVVTAGLLFAGTAGTAAAAPPDDSPSPSGTSASGGSPAGDTSSPPSQQEEQQAQQETEQLAKAHWVKRGHYPSEQSCRKAGKAGVEQHKWREYKCQKHYDHDEYHWWWWLYTR
ncbi:hypothetical protein [Streptomyces caatingaensis]|uniref:Uncharacterized protein n=1 Tax=Streptomyces caatingaensis TaxID=1678637 RepID=A0A0K9X9X9_9ACTN|nr:hypothetical protein [Streptomyces caatingaensis]KNB50199.1 hypothetical protein AC230_26305 [Streptomyces caatingaensis]